MDTTTQKQNDSTDTIDMVFDLLPEGVEDFMWSTQYEELVGGIKKTLSLTDEQTELVKDKGRDLLARLKELPDVAQELIQAGIPKELAAKILYLIDEGILQPVAAVVAEQNEPSGDEKTESTDQPKQSVPEQKGIFDVLNQKLTTTTKIAPSFPQASPAATIPAQQHSIDPYREIPEK